MHPVCVNPLNSQFDPICHLLALLGAHHILHVSRIRIKQQPDWGSGRHVEVSLSHTPLGRTPLDERSARRRGRYLHNKDKGRTCMTSAGFEPAILINPAVTGLGSVIIKNLETIGIL
jgi:hypothetical protein